MCSTKHKKAIGKYCKGKYLSKDLQSRRTKGSPLRVHRPIHRVTTNAIAKLRALRFVLLWHPRIFGSDQVIFLCFHISKNGSWKES